MQLQSHFRFADIVLVAPLLLNGCGDGAHQVPAYTVSGSVSGLVSGAQVTVQLNGNASTTVKANGAFTFATPLTQNGSYSVTVVSQPPAQTCLVTAGMGSGVSANVSGIGVHCGPSTETVLHDFNPHPDGSEPASRLLKGSDGNFYGTTSGGGTGNIGTVFKVTPAGVETVLHQFVGGPTDGGATHAGLIEGRDGYFYGTTAYGGQADGGTVFKITSDGVETILTSFAFANGGRPAAALVQGGDGNFYGTTSQGGANNLGTVFKISPAGVTTTLYSFAGGPTDGLDSESELILGNDGNLYGTTMSGGANNQGTVFKVTPAGVETVLHSFGASATDGVWPGGPLVEGSDGNFYGVTIDGGTYGIGGVGPLHGTVFKVTPAGVETVLHSFGGPQSDVALPEGALVIGIDGNFYGTAGNSPDNTKQGAIFELTPAGTESVFYQFSGFPVDGAYPSGLIQDSDGSFYVVTAGGASNSGAIEKIAPSGIAALLYSFNSSPEGIYPVSLIEGRDQNLYVTTLAGGTYGSGTLTQFTHTGQQTNIASFNYGFYGVSVVGMIQGSDGNFYGTATNGGAASKGTVFKVTPAGVQTVLHSFTGYPSDGSTPYASLIEGRDGNFYGTTSGGGTNNVGTAFKITPDGLETVLHSFLGSDDSKDPFGALVQGSDGDFYGTASGVDNDPNGTVFKITASGAYTILHSFGGGPTDGKSPGTALTQGSDGNFYGTTASGGANDKGTVFRITPSGMETVLYSFGSNKTDAAFPNAPLIQGNDGNFYGVTGSGGLKNQGALIRITPAGAETVLYNFTGGPTDGAAPNSLIIAGDGHFYGTTSGGGVSGAGTLFEF